MDPFFNEISLGNSSREPSHQNFLEKKRGHFTEISRGEVDTRERQSILDKNKFDTLYFAQRAYNLVDPIRSRTRFLNLEEFTLFYGRNSKRVPETESLKL